MSRHSKKMNKPTLITALEPRVLLDGAAVLDAAQAYTSNDYMEQLALPLAVAPVTDSRREWVFIDASLPDYKTLVEGAPADAEVFLIQANEDGFSKIAQLLNNQLGIDAIHILGHGSAGEATLGSAILNANTLQGYNELLASIGSALTPNGDILLYGCNIAVDDKGIDLVTQLAQITQADIAASDDLTGFGGDWELETSTGTIESAPYHMDNYYDSLAGSSTTTVYTGSATGKTSGSNTHWYRVYNNATFNAPAYGQEAYKYTIAAQSGPYGSGFFNPVPSSWLWASKATPDFAVSNQTYLSVYTGGDGNTSSYTTDNIHTSRTNATPDNTAVLTTYYAYAPNWGTSSTLSAQSVLVGESLILTSAMLGSVSDSDSNNSELFFRATNLGSGAIEKLDTSTNTWSTHTSRFSRQEVMDGKIRWAQDGTVGNTSITFSLFDQYGLNNKGTQTSTKTMAMTVIPNMAPTLTTVNTLTGATEDSSYSISFADLAAASDEADTDVGDTLSFRIEAVSTGSLSKNGNPVVGGTTTLGSGESLLWTPAADAFGTLNAFTVKAFDGKAVSATAVQVQVQTAGVDDAPVFTSATTATVNEGVNLAQTVVANDSKDLGNIASYSLVGGADQSSFTINANTGALTFNNTPDYEVAGDADGDNDYVVTVRASDGNLTTDQTITITVANINEAPVVTSQILTGLNEDPVSNNGTAVSALVSGISDGDDTNGSPDQRGIAITYVDTTNGSWEYSVNGGTNWSSLFGVTPTAARLLAADNANHRVRFVPNADYHGSASFTFRAWDQHTGTAGGTANVSTHGGATAYSASEGTASISITAVNDAPVISPLADYNMVKNTTSDIALSATDVEGDSISWSVAVSGPNATDITASIVNGSTLRLIPGTGVSGPYSSGDITITVTADDGNGGSHTESFDILRINAAPVLGAINDVTLTEDQSSATTLTLSSTDPEGDAVTYSVSGGSANTIVATISGSTLSLLPAENFYTNGSAITLTVTAHDAYGATHSQNLNVTVTAANEAPSFTEINATGSVDSGFGSTGVIVTSLGNSHDKAYDMLVQADGKTLVAGRDSSGKFSLVRYLDDGSLDTSFDTDGKLITNRTVDDAKVSIVQQADGKIVAIASNGDDIRVMRFNANGSWDTSFSSDGHASFDWGRSAAEVGRVLVQNDGKILIAGDVYKPQIGGRNGSSWYRDDWVVMRLHSNGNLDTSFGNSGYWVHNSGSYDYDRVYDMALQDDGKIVVVGAFDASSYSRTNFAVARLNTNGSLDSSFSSDGLLEHNFGNYDYAYAVHLQDDGKILVGGERQNDMAIVRFNSNGSLDTSFSRDGSLINNLGNTDEIYDIKTQADGKILVLGKTNANSHTTGYYAYTVLRYHSDGSLDTSFANNGIFTHNFHAGNKHAYAQAMEILGNGDIVISGHSVAANNGYYEFASIRLNSAGELAASPATTLNGTPNYTENAAAVLLDADVAIFENDLSVLNNGAGDFAGASLTIVRNGGASANDVFSLNTNGTSFTNNSGNLQSGGNTFATWSLSSGTLSINFTSSGTVASTALVNEVMRNIYYANSSDNPVSSVQLDWSFSDGNSGNQGSGGALTATGSTTVSIAAVNDAPTLSAIPDQSKAEGTSPWTIDLSNYGSDAEGSHITYTVAASENGTYSTSVGSGVQASISGSILTLTVNANFSNDASPLEFWIKASDGSLVDKTSFNVTIAGINAAPEFGAGDGLYLDSRIDSSVGDIKAMIELPDGDLLLSYMENSYNKLVRIGGDGTVVDYRTSIASANDILVNNGVDQYTLFGTKFDTTWDIAKGYAGSFDVEANNLLSNTSNSRNIKSGFDNDSYDTYYPVSTAYQKDAMNNYLLVAAIDFTDPNNSNYRDPYVTLNRFKQWSNTAIADSTTNDRAGVMISTSYQATAETKDIIVDSTNSYAYVITRQNYTDTYRNNYGIGIHKFSLASSSISYVSSATFDPVPNNNSDGVDNTSIKAYMAADGGIYIGYRNQDTHDNELVKLTSSLAVDTSFGTNGIVNLDNIYGNNYVGEFNAIQVQSDGKILFAASAGSGNITSPGGVSTQDVQMALGRLNTDGSTDTSFSGNGYVLSSELPGVVRTNTYDDSQILIDANGNINWAFVALDPDQNNKKQIVIARFDAAGNLDSDFNATGALNGLPAFLEDSAAVKLDTDVALADSELNQLNGGSGDYAGASLTISRNGGAALEDQFGFDTTGASFSVAGNALQTANKTFATFTNTNGSLVINFTSGATKATSALVNNVMQHITYANDSDNPSSSVQLDWSFNDGGADGRQGTGGGLAATGSTTVSITAVNDAPTLSVADQTITEDQAGTVTLTASDPEGEAVTYAIQSAGSAVTVQASLSGNVLTLTPAANYNGGPVNITVRATDATGGYTDKTFAVSVTAVNDAPVADVGSTQLQTERTSGNTNASFYIDSFAVSDIEDQNSGNVTVTLATRDVHGIAYGNLTLSTSVANGVAAGDVQNNGSGLVTITSTIAKINTTLSAATGLQYAANSGMDFVAQGADLITLSVTDSDNATSTAQRQVFVLPAKPTANSKNFVIDEDDPALAIDLAALVTSYNGTGDDFVLGDDVSPNAVSASDGTGGALTNTWAETSFSESLSLGTLADDTAGTFDDGQFVYTANANANGVETFLYRFSDSGGNTEVAQISIYVLPVNDAPVLTAISNQVLTEDVAKTISLSATDVENEAITYTVTGGSPSTVVASISGSQLTLTPAADYETSTPMSFTVTATDASGGSHSQTFTATVTGVADDPRMSAIADQVINEDSNKVITLDAYDPDGSAITYSLVDDGAANTVQASLSGNEITLTPAANYYGGPVNITVRATDASGATVDKSFDVTVNSVNDAPVLAAIANQTLTEDTAASVSLSSTDVENDTVTYSVVGGSSQTISASITGSTLTLTPAADYDASTWISFTVTAIDANGGTHSQTFQANVAAVNDAPVITAVADQSMTEDTGHTVTLSVSDAENDNYTLAVSGGSVTTINAEIQGNNLLLTPAANYNTSTPVRLTVTATDEHGTSSTQTVDVTVAAVNDAPQTTIGNSTWVTERSTDNPTASFHIDGFSVSDVDDANVTVVLSSKDLGSSDYYGFLTVRTDVTNGISANDISGNGTGQVTITSTVAKINTTFNALLSVAYAASIGRDYVTNGADVITMTTTDGAGATHTATKNLYVIPAAPTAYSTNIILDEDNGPYSLDLMEQVIDLNVTNDNFILGDDGVGTNLVSNADGTGGDLSTAWAETSLNETLTLGTLTDDTAGTFDDGLFTYTPNDDAHGTEKFLYQYESSGQYSEVAQVAIYLIPVNDAPTLADVTDVTFAENTVNATPQLLDSAVTFADVDNVDFDTGVLTIKGLRPTETLGLQNQAVGSSGNLQLSGANVQVSDGSTWTTIGTWQGGTASTLTVTFNDQATATHIDNLLQLITYSSSSEAGETAHNLTIEVTDGDDATTGEKHIQVTVTSENDAPVAVADTATAVEAGGVNNKATGPVVSGNVLTNDSDVDSEDVLSVASVRLGNTLGSGSAGTLGTALAGTYGSLIMKDDGSYVYNLDNSNATVDALDIGDSLTEQFNYTVSDGAGGTVDVLLTIAIDGSNDTPDLALVAAASFTDTAADDTHTAVTGTLSASDVDASASLTYAIVGQASDSQTIANVSYDISKSGQYGTLHVNSSTGAYTYVPNDTAMEEGKANGQDLFTLQVSDGNAVASQLLTVTYTAANDTPQVSASVATFSYTDTNADDSFNPLRGQLSSTDRDAGDTATYSINGQQADTSRNGFTHSLTGSYGQLFLNANTGLYEYVPNDSAIEALSINANENFTLTVSDSDGSSHSTNLTIQLTATSDRPELAMSLADTTYIDTAGNDTFTAVTGSLSSTDRDSSATALYGIQGHRNNTSLNGYDVSKVGTYGELFLNTSTGAYKYQPNDSAMEGQVAGSYNEQFTFSVTDGGLSGQKQFTVYVVGASDNPVITQGADTVALTETNGRLTATGSMMVVDLDLTDQVNLTTQVATSGNHGLTLPSQADLLGMMSLTPSNLLSGGSAISAPFTWSFDTGNTSFNELDTGKTIVLTYTITATDTGTPALSDTDSVTITITGSNDSPVLSTISNVSITETAANDTIADVDGSLVASDVDDSAVLTYTVAGGQADTSVNGFTHSTTGTFGSLYLNANSGTYRFVANNTAVQALSSNTTELFSLTVSDGSLRSTQSLQVDITAANDTPELSASATSATYYDTDATDSFAMLNGSLSATDRDTGATQSYSIDGAVANTSFNGYTHSKLGSLGTLYIHDTSGAYVYVPNATAINALTSGNTQEQFTLRVSDGSASDTQVLTISAAGVSDQPVITAGGDSASLTETNGGLTTTGSFTVADGDKPQSISLTGSVAISGTGATSLSNADALAMLTFNNQTVLADNSSLSETVTWTFNSGNHNFDYLTYGETLIFTYTVTAMDSGTPAKDVDTTVTITVTGTNDNPVATADSTTVAELGASTGNQTANNVTGNLLSNDTDIDQSDSHTVSRILFGQTAGVVGQALAGHYGALIVLANGSYTYDVDDTNLTVQALASATDTLTETYTYHVADNHGGSHTEQLQITITGSNDKPYLTANQFANRIKMLGESMNLRAATLFGEYDQGDSVVSYAASNLPDGLSINSRTGVINGQLSRPGSFNVAIVATDSHGAQRQASRFLIQVLAPNSGGGTGANGEVTKKTTKSDGTGNNGGNNGNSGNGDKGGNGGKGTTGGGPPDTGGGKAKGLTSDIPLPSTGGDSGGNGGAMGAGGNGGNGGNNGTGSNDGTGTGVGNSAGGSSTGGDVGTNSGATNSGGDSGTNTGGTNAGGDSTTGGGNSGNGETGTGSGGNRDTGRDANNRDRQPASRDGNTNSNTSAAQAGEDNASDNGQSSDVQAENQPADTKQAATKAEVAVAKSDRVSVNVGRDGRVNIEQNVSVVSGASSGLILVEVAISQGSVAISFADFNAVSQTSYAATMPNGDPLPEWIQMNPITGELQGTPPPGVSELTIIIQANDGQGIPRTLEIDIDFATGTSETTELSSVTSTLSEQLEQVQRSGNHYGLHLLEQIKKAV